MSDGFQFNQETLKLIRDHRLLRLLHVLIGLDSGLTAREVAKQLKLNPSEISRSLESLQDALGLPAALAKHIDKNWVLSPEGKLLAIEARALLPHVDRFAGRAFAISRNKGHIRLGCFNHAVSCFVADALGHLRGSDFNYEVALSPDMGYRRQLNAFELLQQVAVTLDYAIAPVALGSQIEQESLQLYQYQILVVTSIDHPLRYKAIVTPKDLLEALDPPQVLLLPPGGYTTRNLVDNAFSLAGRSPDRVFDTPEPFARYKLAVNGIGIATIAQDDLPAEALNPLHPWPVLESEVEPHDLIATYVLAWATPTPIGASDHGRFVDALVSTSRTFAASYGLTI